MGQKTADTEGQMRNEETVQCAIERNETDTAPAVPCAEKLAATDEDHPVRRAESGPDNERKNGEGTEKQTAEKQTAEKPCGSEYQKKVRDVIPQKTEWGLAALLLLAAYVYESCLFDGTWLGQFFMDTLGVSSPVLLSVFTLLFTAAGWWYGSRDGRRPGKRHPVYLAMVIAAALWFFLFLDSVQPVDIYMVLFLHGMAVYWLLVVAENRHDGCLNEWAPADLGRALCSLPFSNSGRLFSTAGNLTGWLAHNRKNNARQISQILLGVTCSIPLLCVVLTLLVRADQWFAYAVSGMLEHCWQVFDFWPWFHLSVALVIAMYLFGMFYGVFHTPCPSGTNRTALPQIVLLSFLMVFVIVYVLFFSIKLAGVSGAMKQIEEGTLWTSTYARDGFFELCGIAAINFLMFALIRWYSPRAQRMMKLTLTVLGVQTLAFICLAFSKMGLYITTYGLTFKRVFTCWFMAVLFLTFTLLMVEIWKNFNGLRIAVMAGSISFLILAYSNMPAWITAYNTSFQAGQAVVCQTRNHGSHLSIVYENREYVPYCPIDPGYRGDYLGFLEGDKNNKIYEFEGFSRQAWIITYQNSGIMNDTMLYREMHITGEPMPGVESEYEWNRE